MTNFHQEENIETKNAKMKWFLGSNWPEFEFFFKKI
jgi:hypothetical protein